jgi:hypothetical protein
MIINALMNFPSSARAAQAYSQAVLGSSVLITDVPVRWLDKAWMAGGIASNADAYPAGKVVTAWAPDEVSGHFATLPWLAKSSNLDFKCGKASIQIDGLAHDMASLNKPVNFTYTRPETWIELDESEDIIDIDVWVMNRQWGRVKSPGLWDYPNSYYDVGTKFDSNRKLDASTKSLDISMNGFVGMKLIKRSLIDHTGEASVGVIEASAASMYIDSSTCVYDMTWSDNLVWTLQKSGSLTDPTMFNAATTTAINFVTATAAQKASTAFGATLSLGDLSAGHAHRESTLTKGQIATAKSGTSVTITSQYQSLPGEVNHSHVLVVSWRDGWIVEVQGNHGHDITIKEAS